MNNNPRRKATDFADYLAKELKNPIAKKYFDEYGRQLELSYGLLQLRKKRKLSQAALAAKIGTTQSNIARLESGQQNFSIGFLHKITQALDCELKISFKE
jgi:ribosome-binding protein aMBF1 (putative translation factor)